MPCVGFPGWVDRITDHPVVCELQQGFKLHGLCGSHDLISQRRFTIALQAGLKATCPLVGTVPTEAHHMPSDH